jgi:hypothetical protein
LSILMIILSFYKSNAIIPYDTELWKIKNIRWRSYL